VASEARLRFTQRSSDPAKEIEILDRIVLRSDRYSAPAMPSLWSVNISSNPSRREAAAPG
jgi:hypothetical protein